MHAKSSYYINHMGNFNIIQTLDWQDAIESEIVVSQILPHGIIFISLFKEQPIGFFVVVKKFFGKSIMCLFSMYWILCLFYWCLFPNSHKNNQQWHFSSYLGKPTLHLDPFSKPASYNTCKVLDGVTSTLWVVPSKSLSKWLLDDCLDKVGTVP